MLLNICHLQALKIRGSESGGSVRTKISMNPSFLLLRVAYKTSDYKASATTSLGSRLSTPFGLGTEPYFINVHWLLQVFDCLPYLDGTVSFDNFPTKNILSGRMVAIWYLQNVSQ